MTYFVSDIHGEYDLFLKLLDKIGFSDSDVLYVLGDMIDKGEKSVKTVDFIRREPNIKAILGNHEYDFLKYYNRLMRSLSDDDDAGTALRRLREYFPTDKENLSWETVDYLESLPFYIEKDEYICVHAGLETDENGIILPMREQTAEVMVYSREFKSFNLSPRNKTVLFGHTPCSYENGDGKFIRTDRSGNVNLCGGISGAVNANFKYSGITELQSSKKLADYSKIRLDTGVYLTNMLGAFRPEDMREFYVEK